MVFSEVQKLSISLQYFAIKNTTAFHLSYLVKMNVISSGILNSKVL